MEIGFLVLFAASLIPPITTNTADLYEALAFMICLLLVGGLTGLLKQHEWIFDIISAFLFGTFIQVSMTGGPVELSVQILGLAILTAGIARGVGLYAPDPE